MGNILHNIKKLRRTQSSVLFDASLKAYQYCFRNVDNTLWRIETYEIPHKYLYYIIIIVTHINIGIFIAIYHTLFEVIVGDVVKLKVYLIKKVANKFQDSLLQHISYGFWITFSVALGALNSIFINYIEPEALKSGEILINCYINGICFEKAFKMKTVFIKTIGTIFALIAGLPIGGDGPMIHFAGMLGFQIYKAFANTPGRYSKIFHYFKTETFKRSIMLTTFGTSFGTALSSPLGGVLLCLEETSTFWSRKLLMKTFLTSAISAYVKYSLYNIINRKSTILIGMLNAAGLLSVTFELYELPVLIIMGFIGGIFGALWIKINLKLKLLRSKVIIKKWQNVLEAATFIIIYISIGYIAIYLLDDCVKRTPQDIQGRDLVFPISLNFSAITTDNCTKNELNRIELLWYYPPPVLTKNLLQDTPDSQYNLVYLGVIFIIYYFSFVYCTGLKMVIGGFFPIMLLGALWGRWIGEFLRKYIPFFGDHLCSGKYALIGLAAQMAGITRMTISLVVVVVEITGGSSELFLPIAITVFVAKLTGDLVNKGSLEIAKSQYPILPYEPLPCIQNKKVEEIMEHPVKCVLLKEQIKYVYNLLMDSNHSGYPVVEDASKEYRSDGAVIGFILRQDLLFALKIKLYEETRSKWIDDIFYKYSDQENRKIRFSDILMPSLEEMNYTLNFSLLMFKPFRVSKHTYISEIYSVIRGLCLQEIVVVDEKNRIAGILKQKNILC